MIGPCLLPFLPLGQPGPWPPLLFLREPEPELQPPLSIDSHTPTSSARCSPAEPPSHPTPLQVTPSDGGRWGTRPRLQLGHTLTPTRLHVPKSVRAKGGIALSSGAKGFEGHGHGYAGGAVSPSGATR